MVASLVNKFASAALPPREPVIVCCATGAAFQNPILSVVAVPSFNPTFEPAVILNPRSVPVPAACVEIVNTFAEAAQEIMPRS